MQIISNRLIKIFQILLKSKEPVSISAFADILNVSKRTVFRELENVDAVLSQHGLRLEASVKEGLYLVGDDEAIQAFAKELGSVKHLSSPSKEERRKIFALAVLDSTDFQKLYYYATMLEVSEATLSLDLDGMEEEFKGFEVTLIRKKGIGIAVQGEEKNIRKALVYYLSKKFTQEELLAGKYKFLDERTEYEMDKILNSLSIQVDWITPDSLAILACRLCVQAERIKKAQFAKEDESVSQHGVLWQLAQKIADEMQKRLAINMPRAEVTRIAKGLISARAKQKNPMSDAEEMAVFSKVRSLTFLLIERFDARIAPTLKNDEEFVRGLSIHLWSAIERLKNGYEIKDPLNGQIKTEYPDVYSRTRQAAMLLEEEFSKSVPESEIACLAAHFGAALMQVGRKGPNRRLRVGIVCLGGIGVSYMLNSQIKKRFSADLITEISDYTNREQWERNDFIISTIPLDGGNKPVILVSPILTQNDYETIQGWIENAGTLIAAEGVDAHRELEAELESAKTHLQEVVAILHHFQKVSVSDVVTVEDVAKFTGYRFANDAEFGEIIYHDLMKRESLSSQIIESMQLLLLHCVTKGVVEPVVTMLSFDGKQVVNTVGKTAKTCLVMLMPENASRELKESVGQISVALVEDESFLQNVLCEDEQAVFTRLQMIMQNHLSTYFSNMFK